MGRPTLSVNERVRNGAQAGPGPGPDHFTVRQAADILAGSYGEPVWRSHGEPLDELIGTILSQSTSDINSQRAYLTLRSRFESWDDVALAELPQIEDAIRSGGLARTKAVVIRDVLLKLRREHGSATLAEWQPGSVAEARAYLTAFPGVGPKTANCVLLFSLGWPAMPVDTHVYRVGTRVGFIPVTTPPARAHEVFERELPADRQAHYAAHMNLIRHGRQICHARTPECGRCALGDGCCYRKTTNPGDDELGAATGS